MAKILTVSRKSHHPIETLLHIDATENRLVLHRLVKILKYFNGDFSHMLCQQFTSVGLNSTLQPMEVLGGGGLNRTVCQLVDWMF